MKTYQRLSGRFFFWSNKMLCAIYKSLRKPGCYLYISKRDDFSAVPDVLIQSFGKPQFLMPFNLKGSKPLVHVDKNEVMEKITLHYLVFIYMNKRFASFQIKWHKKTPLELTALLKGE